MSTQFSDHLAAHAARIAELWSERSEPWEPGGDAAGRAARDPRQFINAVLVALTANDLRPLIAYYHLNAVDRVEAGLSTAMRHLQTLRQATDQSAAELRLDAGATLALARAGGDDIGTIGGQLAVGCVSLLEKQLARATSASSARGTSLSITMHELRRPLTILNSYGQLLSTGMLGTLPETAMVAIEGVTASTEMMVRMVNALAELARLEDPDDQMSPEVMDANDVAGGALEQVAMEAKLRGIVIKPDVAAGVRVNADRRRLTLALTNLLGNAIKHGPPQSTIELRVHADDAGAHFLVRDHGTGFPPEDADHLFDKYFRSVAERQRKVPGSGLGLYIVRTVAERHRGSVVARTIEGNGAEFEMIIPTYQKER
jgi:signal transduction histidine kinase